MFHRISEGQKRYFGINYIKGIKRFAIALVIPLFPILKTRYEFDVDETLKGWVVYSFYIRVSKSIHNKYHYRFAFNYLPVGKQTILNTRYT